MVRLGFTSLSGIVLIAFTAFGFAGESNWQPVGGRIATPWAKDMDSDRVLPEYPRPQLQRREWQNLNGLWRYAISPELSAPPENWDGDILVPFAVESSLSGVGKSVGPDKKLWYQTSFSLPKTWVGRRVILHFDAVDWQTRVYLNGRFLGEHCGAYDSFSFDITPDLVQGGTQELLVSVWDPADGGYQPRGKQVDKPRGIWYTSVSGIWGSVWLEPVAATHVRSLRIEPDVDRSRLSVYADVVRAEPDDRLELTLLDGGKQLDRLTGAVGSPLTLSLRKPLLWSPDSPHLYDLQLRIKRRGKVVDELESYAALRKISLGRDRNGIQRILLNNRFLFQLGLLDQGWWPDGLYTAPSDQALQYDIQQTKAMGYNMIRKHVKVEPQRWYYHCDRLGVLVWQDMPSGDAYAPSGDGNEIVRSAQSAHQYRSEWQAVIDGLRNHPCIVMWVPFNEGWGQFRTIETLNWTAHYDPSRLVDGPSGWSDFYGAGHVQDRHEYPGPAIPVDKRDGRALVLGEFGGLGYPVEGHTWQEKANWGYRNISAQPEYQAAYEKLIDQLPELIRRGLSAAVYTQTTDVETEVNGLMSYDRRVSKMDPARLQKLHRALYRIEVDF